MGKLSVVGIYNEDWQAHIALAELAENGIEAIINNEIMSTVYPIGAMGGIRILVREEDAEVAARLLNDLVFD